MVNRITTAISIQTISVLLLIDFSQSFRAIDTPAIKYLEISPRKIYGNNPGPRDCTEIRKQSNGWLVQDGVHRIWTNSWTIHGSFEVYCDMTTDGGGWTVVQRRNPEYCQLFFDKTWKEYKNGFGDLRDSHWIGNDRLFALTSQDTYELRIDLRTSAGTKGHATYRMFWVENEDQLYRLNVNQYSGDIGDMFDNHNGWLFSTKDCDNDSDNATNCAVDFKAGWWYRRCQYCNLNGISTLRNNSSSDFDTIWNNWRRNEPIVFTEMKIRPSNFFVYL